MEIYILSALLGLTFGSFLNVVIYRTEKEKTVGGRSFCPKCKKPIAWYDNIPLLSYLLLGGKCRHCHKKISAQYPIIETLTALTFLSVAYLVSNNLLNDWLGHYFSLAGLLSLATRLGNWPLGFGLFSNTPSLFSLDINIRFFELIFLFLVSSTLIAILVYDFKHMLIPDSYTITGIIIVAVYNLLADFLLLSATLISKNQLFIMEASGLSKKYQVHNLLPINISAFLGQEPTTFYPQMLHLKSFFSSVSVVTNGAASISQRPLEFILSLLTDTRTGSGLLAGLAVAGIFFLIVYISNETWMGMGDVKLVFFLGFLLGIFKTVVALFLAFELGAIFGIALILFGRAKMKTALPFGPFLIIGAVLSLLFI